ncbi:MAG: hypothetical protein AB1439_10250 [candidate division FCPU426 bacterium]
MIPKPETDNNYLLLLNKSSLDLVRATERQRLRQALAKAVMKQSQQLEPLLQFLKERWPSHQAVFYRN